MNVLRHLVFVGVVAVGIVCIVPSGRAQDLPCTEEIRKFCAEVQPGGGRIMQCLKQHEARLSSACAQRMDDMLATVSTPVGKACRDDWAALCYHPRAATDRKAMVECLQAHRAKVSAGCKKAMDEGSGKPQQRRGMMP